MPPHTGETSTNTKSSRPSAQGKVLAAASCCRMMLGASCCCPYVPPRDAACAILMMSDDPMTCIFCIKGPLCTWTLSHVCFVSALCLDCSQLRRGADRGWGNRQRCDRGAAKWESRQCELFFAGGPRGWPRRGLCACPPMRHSCFRGLLSCVKPCVGAGLYTGCACGPALC